MAIIAKMDYRSIIIIIDQMAIIGKKIISNKHNSDNARNNIKKLASE